MGFVGVVALTVTTGMFAKVIYDDYVKPKQAPSPQPRPAPPADDSSVASTTVGSSQLASELDEIARKNTET